MEAAEADLLEPTECSDPQEGAPEAVEPVTVFEETEGADLAEQERRSSGRDSGRASRNEPSSGSVPSASDHQNSRHSSSQPVRTSSSAPAGDQSEKKLHGSGKSTAPQQPPLPRTTDDGLADTKTRSGTHCWATVNRERVYPVFDHTPVAPANSRGVAVLSQSLRTHPKGFRLLKQTSPLERRMNTYFRLPAQPPRRIQEEQERLQRQIQREIIAPQAASATAASSKPSHDVMLDGFMLLEMAGVQDPLDAKEVVINDAHIRGVVSEDLTYFTNLTFLDLGENESVHLGDVIGLEALTEVHLHCCNVDTFRLPSDEELHSLRQQGVYNSASVFPNLVTLNVSFNRIRSSELLQLGQLNALERLDLSSNNLKSLPADMSFLPNVTMLALENNNFSSPNVILSLATMPSLVEVNLNRNRLSTIPRLSVEDGTGVCFPSIEVIGLGSNNLTYFEDVYSLTQISSLRRVVLWGNPIQHRVKDTEIIHFEFGTLDIEVLFELPIPPKRKIADFYAANASNFVSVSGKDLKPLPVVKLNRQFATGATVPAAAPPAGGPEGPSFFVTQPGDISGSAAGADQPPGPAEHHPHMQAEDPSDPSWFSGEQRESEVQRPRQQRPPVGSTGLGSELAGGGVAATPASDDLQPLPDGGGDLLDDLGSYDGGVDFSLSDGRRKGGKKAAPSSLRSRGTAEDIVRPSQTMRAAMTELRRMLRQPLPPIHVTQYEQTTQSLSQRIVRQR
jgi:hypothetical protein